MSRVFEPRVFQKRAIEFMLDTPKCALFASMGIGKTSSTLAVIDALNTVEGEKHTFVFAPKRVATMTWPDEIEKWADFAGLDTSIVTGTAAERRAALRRDRAIHLMNYENIPWLLAELKGRWPFQRAIADESSKLKAPTSKRFAGTPARARKVENGVVVQERREATPGLKHFAHLAERWINLTGTPTPNGLEDLWSQIYVLDGGRRLGNNITAFRNRWFVRDASGYGHVPLPHAFGEIMSRIQDICLTLDSADYFDLPPLVDNPIYVELPPDARRFYRELEREYFAVNKGREVEAVNSAVLSGKLLQVANGAVYTSDSEEKEWTLVHDAKLEALEDIFEEACGAPVMVAYNFKHDLARLQAAHPDGRVMDDNPQTLRDWNAGRIGKLWIHPDSAGHGLNMQDGGNILVFFSQTNKLESYLQIIERIGPMRQVQGGYDRPCFVHSIIARRTYDEIAVARGLQKAATQDAVREYMKRIDW